MTDLKFKLQAAELRELAKRAKGLKDRGAKAAAETSSDYASRLERQIERHEDEREALINEIDRIYQDRFKHGQPRREGKLVGEIIGTDLQNYARVVFTFSPFSGQEVFMVSRAFASGSPLVSIQADKVDRKHVGHILTKSKGTWNFNILPLGVIFGKRGTKKNVYVKREDLEGNVVCWPSPLDPRPGAKVFLYEDFFVGDIKSEEDFRAFAAAADKAHSRARFDNPPSPGDN